MNLFTRFSRLVTTLIICFFSFTTLAQVSLTSGSGGTYTQDFNTLASTGTTNTIVPAGWAFFEFGTGSSVNQQYVAGTGSSNAGDTYSFGASGSTERAFGSLLSGNLNTFIGAGFLNNTGKNITSVTIAYTGEQWRNGNINRVDKLDFQYSINATSLNTGTWTNLDALDFASPNVTSGTPLDGNLPGNRTLKAPQTITFTIPAGATFYIRWEDFNPSGADDGLGVDDFSLSYTVLSSNGGIFESYAILNYGAADVYYDLQAPPTSTNPDFTGNLGTFNSSQVFKLSGFEQKVYKCNSLDITNGHIWYRIYPTGSPTGSFGSIGFAGAFNIGGAGPGCQNQQWFRTNSNLNLLSGLCDGNYTLEVYTSASYTGDGTGTFLSNNGGANYTANFSVNNATQSGIYLSYAIVNGSYYDMQASTGNPDFEGANLGTFCSNSGSLVLGGQNKVYKCPPNDITNNFIYYRIYPGTTPSSSFVPLNLPYVSPAPEAPGAGCTNQLWESATASTNLLTGLAAGNYTIELYSQAVYNSNGICGSFHYTNNGGAYYKATFTVNTPPVLTVPANINLSAGAACSAVATYTATATGSPAPTITYSQASGSTFPPGSTTVNVTATNSCGTATGSFTVTVTDATAPVITSSNQTVILDATGNATILLSAVASATDNCPGVVVNASPLSFTCADIVAKPTDLIISEYVEGSSNNKAIELYNGTNAPISLSGYSIRVYSNGATIFTTVSLAGTIAAGGTFVIAHPSSNTAILSAANQTSTIISFNGDDAVALNKAGTNIDIFGNIGSTAWSGATTTTNVTLQRKANVNAGSTGSFSLSQWNSFATDFSANLGTHSLGSPVTITAIDASGNSTTGTATVTVVDNLAPVAPTLANATGECSVTVTAPTTSDNCTAVVTGTTTDPLTYNTQGTYTINWTFTDASGNASSATQTVVVDDVTAPDVPVLADATGECSVTVTAPETTDNCVFGVVGTTTDPLTYTTQGSYVVTWTFDDGNGNTSTATQNVIVDDVTPPATPILSDALGECAASVTAPTTTDNCAGTITGTTTDPLTYNSQGSFVVTWSFNDGNGNISTATQNVIVDDITAPDVPTLADATGECSVTVTAPETTDNCVFGVVGTTTDPLTYTTQGSYVVTWTFDDGNGNTSTATQNVIVDDVTPPATPILSDALGECAASVTAPTTSDNCAGTITGTTTDPTSYTAQGTYTVNWSFDDGNGNVSTATQTVVVDDVTAPVAPSISTVTGECSASVTAPVATDNCVGPVTGTTTDPTSYTVQGTYTVNWSFNDGNGNTSTATQTVVVDDVTAPVAPSISTVTGECSASVTAPVATDNCVGPVTGTTTDPTSYTAQGTYTVNWSFNDGNGNTSTATQTVVVDDVTAPVAPSISTVTGECSASVTAPVATDNCVGPVTGTTTDPTSYTAQGTYTVNWSFNDGNGNTSTATQTVVVDDVTAPVAPVLSTVTGECSASVTAPIATDNCVGPVTGTTTDPTSYTAQGSYTVNWSFNDGNGNISTAQQLVVVDDVTAPVAPTIANATGECSVTVTAPVATDNCVGPVTGTTTDPLTYNSQGTFTITWRFNDGNGNISTATQTVVVDDVTAPVAPTLSTVTGECSASVTAPVATDNCAGPITGSTTDPLTYTAQGSYTINWSFDDGNGNISTAVQTVIVDDITAPVAPVLATVTGECFAEVLVPTTTDNCSGIITGTTNDDLLYVNQGTFIVHWSFDDGNGNITLVNQTVVVDDVTPPVPNPLPTLTGQCSVTVPIATAQDECLKAIAGTTTDPLFYNTQGTHIVHWTFDDGNGNVATANQTVVIDDITAPVISCPSNIVLSACTPTATWAAATATDNCTYGLSVTQIAGPAPGSAFANGSTTTITYRATDAGGNQVTCSFTVTRRAALVASATYTPILCNGTTSQVTVTAVGGNGVYSGTGTFTAATGTHTYTVTDGEGCTADVTVTIGQPSAILTSCSTNNTQLFFGYAADNTATITASATGGTGPYTISFSMDRAMKCNVTDAAGDETWIGGAGTVSSVNTVCPGSGAGSIPVTTSGSLTAGSIYSVTVQLMANAVITATITDANGCIEKCTTPVFAKDVRCYSSLGGNWKVKVCHRTGNGCNSNCINFDAVANHLAHGDFLGDCTANCTAPAPGARSGGKVETTSTDLKAPAFSVEVSPNPAITDFKLQVSSETNEQVQVRVYDMTGKTREIVTKSNPGQLISVGKKLEGGTYFAEVTQGNNRKVVKLVKIN